MLTPIEVSTTICNYMRTKCILLCACMYVCDVYLICFDVLVDR